MTLPEPEPEQAESTWTKALFDTDASVCLEAACELAKDPKSVRAVLGGITQRLRRPVWLAVRTVLRSHAEQAAPAMLAAVRDYYGDWRRASAIASCFDRPHADFVANELAEGLESTSPDVVGLCVDALGHARAASWSYRIEQLLPDKANYHYDKYVYSVLQAMTRFFVATSQESGLLIGHHIATSFRGLSRVVKSVARVDDTPLRTVAAATDHLLVGCEPRLADELIDSGLDSDEPLVRRLAVIALGNLRLSRAVPRLVALIDDVAEPESVKYEAVSSLGKTRSPEALSSLSRLAFDRGDRDKAIAAQKVLAYALDAVPDPAEMKKLPTKLLAVVTSERCWLFRCMGIHPGTADRLTLEQALSSKEPSDRGHAALALARAFGSKAAPALSRALNEATLPVERVLSALALLSAGQVSREMLLVLLREELAHDSWLFKRPTQEDVTSVLSAVDHPLAGLLFRHWKYVYENPEV